MSLIVCLPQDKLPAKLTAIVNSTKQAFEILERTYGNTQDIWDTIMKDLKRRCNRPDV